MIDALRLCLEVENSYHIDQLKKLQVGERYDLYDFHLFRIEGRYFDNVYIIRFLEGEKTTDYGELKFNLNGSEEDNNTHSNGLKKVWLAINNSVFYAKDDLHYYSYIASTLGLYPHNITALDLCCDVSFDVGKRIKAHLRNKEITTILNGKRIKDRSQDRPEISYKYSGSLDKDKYLSVYLKQKKAIKDKSKGLTLTAYNKQAEIANSSGKDYIPKFYGNPRKLYRLEIHLNNEEIKEYFNGQEFDYYYWVLHSQEELRKLFLHHLNRLLRFEQAGKRIAWETILWGI